MKNTCSACGKCCKLFYINLSKKEFESGDFKTMDLDSKVHILDKNPDGSCIYLKNNLCSIHENRPQVCRHFFCSTKSKKFQGMVKMINNNKI
ncbi:MAG: YkgJ family cysteine cluster protein [Candidatus Shapirobacteria bacterium]